MVKGELFSYIMVDCKRKTFYCGVMVNFEQDSRASKLTYCGTIQIIMEVAFILFLTIYIFNVKWFKVIRSGAHAMVKKHPNGLFAIDSIKI